MGEPVKQFKKSSFTYKQRLAFQGKHASSNWQQKKKKRKTKAKK